MVLKKRLEYGFGGFQIPCVPRGPRSVRRRHPPKSLEDSQICAFELLATVAGKLLQESESSASSNAADVKDETVFQKDGIKQEKIEAGKCLKSECLDQGSSVESAFVSEPVVEGQKIKDGFGGSLCPKDCSLEEQTSTVLESDFSKAFCDVKLENSGNVAADGNLDNEVRGERPKDGDPCGGKLEIEIQPRIDEDRNLTEDLTVANDCTVKDPMENYVNNNTLHLTNSESSVHFPLYRERFPGVSFAKHRNDVKLGVRDDGENSYRCYKHSTKIRGFRSQSRIGYKRIRKMLTSRHRKTALRLKECEFSDSYEAVKPSYRSRKIIRARERCHLEISSKRRKLCNHSFAIAYDQEASSESISNLPDKRINGDNRNEASAFVKSHQKSKDPNLKLSIKSFKVPELYIEVPETATVGSLKRTVMEAVTAILAGGLRVGVVLQGKKMRDDNRTLEQAGISHNGNIDGLGFTLEPNLSQVSLVSTPKDAPPPLLAAVETEVSGSPASPNLDLVLSTIPSDPSPEIIVDDSNRELVPLLENPTDPSTNVCDPDSKALVAVPPPNAEALAIVPLNRKSRRTELSQRRTRRPFSVAEVEALVGAVEQLGTGRWRDVKMRAFENADHRTYVDLKDKWKTLVHTASIAPQQRRGEPVPQELLNRVLAAHSYWSQHQAKQHGKNHS